MSLTFRNATPRDAPFLAWVMLTASRSHCSYGLWERFVDGTEQECLSFLEKIAVTRNPHLFHHQLFLLAEKNGQPVGGLCGYDPGCHGMRVFVKALPEVYEQMGWSKSDGKTALQRLSCYGACMPDEIPGVWTIECVATAPEIRRQGVMNLLLEAILERGRSHGLRKARIAVLLSNAPARKAYEKAGFRYADEKRDTGFQAAFGDFGIARLLMDLV
jgi:ribosomal protein S18 acetylase RimI-like enzyme